MLIGGILGWRADSNRQHEETISAVRATANEQVPYNVQGVSIDTFCWTPSDVANIDSTVSRRIQQGSCHRGSYALGRSWQAA